MSHDQAKAGTIRVLVVDDHHVVRSGLAAMIRAEENMSLVGEAESGAQALELYRTLSPDVTLMDIRMPGMNGIDVLRSLRKEYPSCAVLMLSSYDGDEDIYQSLQAGARGYLLKSMRNAEIAEAIRIVHAGGHHLPPKVA